jgi:hypothetical protein
MRRGRPARRPRASGWPSRCWPTGRPAPGEAYPLLTRARTLAERLGITVPYTLPGLDGASLDLDV